MSVDRTKIGHLIDSQNGKTRVLNSSIINIIEQQRSNIPTHSTNGLDAHRLRTQGADLLFNSSGYHWLPDNQARLPDNRVRQPDYPTTGSDSQTDSQADSQTGARLG